MANTDLDHAALTSACEDDTGLCTIVNIDGSFSRRLGAQLAIGADGTLTGSLADSCLERQLAADIADCKEPKVVRYGHGSATIDFRLPCGGGLDILLDPTPDRDACRETLLRLKAREPASLTLPGNDHLAIRHYIPRLCLMAFGEDPELGALETLADATGIPAECFDSNALTLGRAPEMPPPDPWTAAILVFHDHEWETAILRHILKGPSFYVGAQGGANARQARLDRLAEEQVSSEDLARVRGPVGVIPSSRTPRSLALSILSEIVAEYEVLHPHP